MAQKSSQQLNQALQTAHETNYDWVCSEQAVNGVSYHSAEFWFRGSVCTRSTSVHHTKSSAKEEAAFYAVAYVRRVLGLAP
jgi:hypothetical protein